MSDLASKVGNMMKELRLEKGWNREELAKKAGIHPGYLGQLERGEKNATIATFFHIIDALGGDWLSVMYSLSQKPKIDPYALYNLLSLLSNYSKEEQKELMSAIWTFVKLMHGKTMVEREEKNA